MSTTSQTDTKTQILTAQGPGAALIVRPFDVVPNPAAILIAVTGNMTYNVELSGDDISLQGYSAAAGFWFPMTGFTALTGSVTGTLGACVSGIRVNITTYISGTLTWQFCQLRRA